LRDRENLNAEVWAGRGGHGGLAALLHGLRPRGNGKKARHKLSDAIEKGNLGEVARVLRGGAFVDMEVYGFTALQAAAFHGKREVFDYLVSQGADVRATTDSSEVGETNAFALACIGYCQRASKDPDLDTDFLESLLEAGLDINHRGRDGMTALHSAIEEGGNIAQLVDFLLSHGADPMIRDKHGKTPFENVCEGSRNIEIVRLLMAHMDVNMAINGQGETPLMVALRTSERDGSGEGNPSVEIVRLLLDREDIDFNIQDNAGSTAMDIAERHSPRVIQDLLGEFTI
jgi:ankyrin repeat protein